MNKLIESFTPSMPKWLASYLLYSKSLLGSGQTPGSSIIQRDDPKHKLSTSQFDRKMSSMKSKGYNVDDINPADSDQTLHDENNFYFSITYQLGINLGTAQFITQEPPKNGDDLVFDPNVVLFYRMQTPGGKMYVVAKVSSVGQRKDPESRNYSRKNTFCDFRTISFVNKNGDDETRTPESMSYSMIGSVCKDFCYIDTSESINQYFKKVNDRDSNGDLIYKEPTFNPQVDKPNTNDRFSTYSGNDVVNAIAGNILYSQNGPIITDKSGYILRGLERLNQKYKDKQRTLDLDAITTDEQRDAIADKVEDYLLDMKSQIDAYRDVLRQLVNDPDTDFKSSDISRIDSGLEAVKNTYAKLNNILYRLEQMSSTPQSRFTMTKGLYNKDQIKEIKNNYKQKRILKDNDPKKVLRVDNYVEPEIISLEDEAQSSRGDSELRSDIKNMKNKLMTNSRRAIVDWDY